MTQPFLRLVAEDNPESFYMYDPVEQEFGYGWESACSGRDMSPPRSRRQFWSCHLSTVSVK